MHKVYDMNINKNNRSTRYVYLNIHFSTVYIKHIYIYKVPFCFVGSWRIDLSLSKIMP